LEFISNYSGRFHPDARRQNTIRAIEQRFGITGVIPPISELRIDMRMQNEFMRGMEAHQHLNAEARAELPSVADPMEDLESVDPDAISGTGLPVVSHIFDDMLAEAAGTPFEERLNCNLVEGILDYSSDEIPGLVREWWTADDFGNQNRHPDEYWPEYRGVEK
jgi:hypothetical protein